MSITLHKKPTCIIAALAFCSMIITGLTLLHAPVSAAPSTNYNSVPVRKALLTGVYRCYNSGAIMSEIPALTSFDSFSDLVVAYTGQDYHTYVALPSGLTNITDNDIDCKNLFIGDETGLGTEGGTFEGILSLAGKPAGSLTPEQKVPFLNGLGYTRISNDDNNCIGYFTYQQEASRMGNKPITTDGICAKVDEQGIITELTVDRSKSDYYLAGADQQLSGAPPFFSIVNGKVSIARAGTITALGVGSSWDDFQKNFRETVSGLGDGNGNFSYTYNVPGGGGIKTVLKYTLDHGSVEENNVGDASYGFVHGSSRDAANTAINYLSNGSLANYEALQFSDKEKLSLLLMSLKEYFYEGVDDEYWVCDVADWADYGGYPENYAINVSPEGKTGSKCRLNPSKVHQDRTNGTIHGFNGAYFDSAGRNNLDLLATIAEINKLADALPNNTVLDINETPQEPEEVSGTTACFENAGALGWIACPVLEAAGGLTRTLYYFIEENFLQLDGSLITTEGVRSGWRQFREFANIVFVIVFIIVILAQLTGIGISNYNVKKILPRLITVVVLVNVSFLLCQLAVDVSNIVGYGIRNLFDSFAQTAANAAGGVPFDFMTVAGGVLGSAFAVGATATVTAVFAITIPWELWLFPIILAVIGCLISIFFFLIILGVRQAGVIVLIALAPVAIVCYALPNTKTVFDRWRKLLSGLLLVYPICGLLMGGGQFASTLLLIVGHEGDVGAFFTIVAMLMSVVPFFLIPSVLRNSMAAAGNLGAKISQFGKGISGGITRGIRNSEWGKNFQRQRQMSYDLKATQKLQKKREQKLAEGKDLGRGASRRLFLHTSAYNRAASEDIRAGGGQELLAPGTPAYEAAQANTANTQLADDTKARRSVYESTMNTGNAIAMGAEYGKALEHLHANPTDRNALVNVRALQDILSETDDGRGQVQSQMNRVLNNHRDFYSSAAAKTQDSALSQAARHLSSAYGGQYKKTNRGTFAMINDFTNKDFSKAFGQSSDGMQYGISEQDGAARSSYYDQAGMTSYTAQTLPEADEGALQGISNTLDGMAELEKNGVTLSEHSAMQRSQIVATAGDALGNANIHMKPKVAEQLQSMVIKGNSAQTIGGTNANALNRMAESIEQNTMSSAEQAQLVSMAQAALSGGHVTNTEKAAALNHILAAAGQPTIDISQPVNGAADVDSGSIPVPHEDSAPTPSPAPARPASDEIFTINPDGTISGGVKPFTISNGRLTDSGIILPPERPNRAQPGSRSSKPGQNGGEGTT